MVKPSRIIDLTYNQAKKFFLTNDAYANLQLPHYFTFEKILTETFCNIEKFNFDKIGKKAKNCETTNHIIYSNIDSKYHWRKFQLINPVIYNLLIQEITNENNWKELISFFNQNEKNSFIECYSMPLIPKNKKKYTATQISEWYKNVELRSMQLGLEYRYLFATDISDFYNSIYTHSIPWALYGRDFAKKNKSDKTLFGNKLDQLIQCMNYGQTNGIPTGSVVMDFIAEIILHKIDIILYQKISKNCGISDYKIIRYRDDYRIFVNNIQDGEVILKCLSEVLLEYGLTLNKEKTLLNSDIIFGSLKSDKIEAINEVFYYLIKSKSRKLKSIDLFNSFINLYSFSKSYQNSGTLKKLLTIIYEKLLLKEEILKKYNYKRETISILYEILYNNPIVIPQVVSLISLLLTFFERSEIITIIDKIKRKINYLPNSGLIEIWLQRLTIKIKRDYDYNEKLCKKVVGDQKVHIFNYDFISDKDLRNILIESENTIVDEEIINKSEQIISKDEVLIFEREGYFEI